MVKWEGIELGSNNLVAFDYENLGASTDSDYSFRYITLENVDNGKLLKYINCTFSSAPSRARRVVHKDDLLISTVRPNLHSHYKVDNDVADVICSTGFCVIKTDETRLDCNFLYSLFNSNIIDKQIELIVTGSSYPAISSNDIRKLIIPLPPLSEQRTIAAALTSADEYITALEKLITKKRSVKKGAMQELLTGKLRLPGFDGEWVEKSIGESGIKLLSGYMFQSLTYIKTGRYKIVTIANVQQNKLDTSNCSVIDLLPADIQEHQLLNRGDILISLTGNVGRTCIVDKELLLLNQRVGVLSNIACDKTFFYYVLQNTRFITEMVISAKGGAQPNLSNKDIYMYEFGLPSTAAEQTAIAAVLSDMDAEINALTTKLEKAQFIKQGMMSELLTGRIRLIEEDMDNGKIGRSRA